MRLRLQHSGELKNQSVSHSTYYLPNIYCSFIYDLTLYINRRPNDCMKVLFVCKALNNSKKEQLLSGLHLYIIGTQGALQCCKVLASTPNFHYSNLKIGVFGIKQNIQSRYNQHPQLLHAFPVVPALEQASLGSY